MFYFAIVLIQSILTYGILVQRLAYKNVLKPLNVLHRTIIRIILKQNYIEDNNTNDLFKILKILNINQLYNKIQTAKIYIIKNQFERRNKNKSLIMRNMKNDKLTLFKLNMTLIKMFYIYIQRNKSL